MKQITSIKQISSNKYQLIIDDKKHVGLRNIEGRLKTMVNGELVIESEVNVGTKAKIMIPKEVAVWEQ